MHHTAGPGTVPALSFLHAAQKEFLELASTGQDAVHLTQQTNLTFTPQGCTPHALQLFLHDALKAGKKHEPTVETGNKYGVHDDFHQLNSQLIMHVFAQNVKHNFNTLDHQQRAMEMYRVIFCHDDLRNRNVLHSGMLDSCVIGNLLNFFKHMFEFPFGGHGTDGNEVLSLCLYSYRQRCLRDVERTSTKTPSSTLSQIVPVVLYMDGGSSSNGSGTPVTRKTRNIVQCARRLTMNVQSIGSLKELKHQLSMHQEQRRIACVMVDFAHHDLEAISNCCSAVGVDIHIHIFDAQWRRVFINHSEPLHFHLPTGVQSVSIEDGLFSSGYSIYRDEKIRDLHLDVGYEWQAAYMSPNEGGSGASTPLFADFCTIMLGWNALHEICVNGGGMTPMTEPMVEEKSTSKTTTTGTTATATATTAISSACHPLTPTLIQPEDPTTDSTVATAVDTSYTGTMALKEAIQWGKTNIESKAITRSIIEKDLIEFQREFIGGKHRQLEAFTTCGGTRSINLAFESVMARVRKKPLSPSSTTSCSDQNFNNETIKVLTGNPHLAVERAERRFRFQLVRLVEDGVLSLPLLKEHVQDTAVAAIYTQTLSYTDGITDQLTEILNIVEEENHRRTTLNHNSHNNLVQLPLITLINDCCLAFSVLCHQPNKRLLDVSPSTITPIIVTLDAHKHLGTDKGISSVIGTRGTLSLLTNSIKVGAQPSEKNLIRALACMQMVGKEKYVQQYSLLGEYMAKLERVVEDQLGLVVIHQKHRVKGSTVLSVEDPSGIYKQKLKKFGHTLASLFNLYPEEPHRCQTGWQLSLTPHGIRDINGTCALDLFIADLIATHQLVMKDSKYQWITTTLGCRENSFIACLFGSGNLDPVLLPFLAHFGNARQFMETFIRRKLCLVVYSLIGIVCTIDQNVL